MLRRFALPLRLLLAALALALVPAAARADAPGPIPEVKLARLERGAGALPRDHAVAVTYQGTIDRELHLATPHAVVHQQSLRRILLAAPDRVRQDWTTWSADDSTAKSLETTILVGGRVLQRDGATGPFTELTGRAAHEAAATIWASVPVLATAHAVAAQGHGLELGPVEQYQSTYFWPESLGKVRIDLGVVDEPTLLTITLDDPWRGSVDQVSRFLNDSTAAGATWPNLLTAEGHPPGTTWRSTETLERVEAAPADAPVTVPDSVVPMVAASTDTVPQVTPLAKGVWAVELPDADTRSLVVEFARQLAVLETSSDGVHAERLIAAIRAKISRKPIRMVSFSHHHPDYIGGLRPFLAESATVVCANSNVNYVREITRWPFTLRKDRLARIAPFGFRTVFDTLKAGRWHYADAVNELVAIDIGARSHHTDAYVVFWLPRAKLLFEGDLGYYARDGKLAASSRAKGLLEAVDAAAIRPLTVVQSWPVKGAPRTLPMARLRALAAARTP